MDFAYGSKTEKFSHCNVNFCKVLDAQLGRSTNSNSITWLMRSVSLSNFVIFLAHYMKYVFYLQQSFINFSAKLLFLFLHETISKETVNKYYAFNIHKCNIHLCILSVKKKLSSILRKIPWIGKIKKNIYYFLNSYL